MAGDQKERGMTYADSGVDINLGDQASRIMYEAAKLTWEKRKGRIGEVIIPNDNFRGIRSIDVGELPKGSRLTGTADGVGTKVELPERLEDHTTIAYDLIAMACDDAAIKGFEPVLVLSILDVNSLGKDGQTHLELVRQVARGYVSAAGEADVAILNGEVAELNNRVGGYGRFNYNWGAVAISFGRQDRELTGELVQPGQAIVGLREHGFRSNGISLARRILEDTYGPEWHVYHGGSGFAREVSRPSRIYTPLLTALTGGFDRDPRANISAAAHLTGGGLPGKLESVLGPFGLGADITRPFKPSLTMLSLQRMGNVPDEEAYRTWNMGQGMAIMTSDPNAVMGVAAEFNMEAQIIGSVTQHPGIRIASGGSEKPGAILSYGS